MIRIIAAASALAAAVIAWVVLASGPADAQLGPGRTATVTISGPVSATGTVALTPPMPASTIASGQSAASFDIAGTTITGGTVLQNFVATNATSNVLDLPPFNIFVGPGETMAVSASATNSGQVGVGLTWDEAN